MSFIKVDLKEINKFEKEMTENRIKLEDTLNNWYHWLFKTNDN